MKIGYKRQRITLQAPVRTQAADGSWVTTWANVPNGARWADIVPLRGEEKLQAQQIQAEVTHRIRLRRDTVTATLTHQHRAIQGGRVFEFLAPPIDVGERRRELEIQAREHFG